MVGASSFFFSTAGFFTNGALGVDVELAFSITSRIGFVLASLDFLAGATAAGFAAPFATALVGELFSTAFFDSAALDAFTGEDFTEDFSVAPFTTSVFAGAAFTAPFEGDALEADSVIFAEAFFAAPSALVRLDLGEVLVAAVAFGEPAFVETGTFELALSDLLDFATGLDLASTGLAATALVSPDFALLLVDLPLADLPIA